NLACEQPLRLRPRSELARPADGDACRRVNMPVARRTACLSRCPFVDLRRTPATSRHAGQGADGAPLHTIRAGQRWRLAELRETAGLAPLRRQHDRMENWTGAGHA